MEYHLGLITNPYIFMCYLVEWNSKIWQRIQPYPFCFCSTSQPILQLPSPEVQAAW